MVVLGSTGSIGRQALDVIAAQPSLEVVGLAVGSDASALSTQAAQHGVRHTGIGADAAARLAQLEDADIVLNGIVGAAGLKASIAALEAGKVLALANKESLVAGGQVCIDAARRGGGRIVPVDSEHAAVAQCLTGSAPDEVRRIVLTASGGPFRTRTDLDGVSVKEALAHPRWEMGPKISVDSATLMNKGLEVIEAHHLFGRTYDQIAVLVHPQSAVHGMVELVDGSTIMHAAPADMRIPIQAALMDGIATTPLSPIDLAALGSLDFEEPDGDRFPALALAYEAGRKGGSYPAVLNAANEAAVSAFLDGRVRFTDIPRVSEEVLGMHAPADASTLDAVLEIDRTARAHASDVITRRAAPAGTGAVR